MLRCLGTAVDYPREGAPALSWKALRACGWAESEKEPLAGWLGAIGELGGLNSLELDDWLGWLPRARQLELGAALAAALLSGAAREIERFQLLVQCVHDHLSARWVKASTP